MMAISGNYDPAGWHFFDGEFFPKAQDGIFVAIATVGKPGGRRAERPEPKKRLVARWCTVHAAYVYVPRWAWAWRENFKRPELNG